MPTLLYGQTTSGVLSGASGLSTLRPGSYADRYTFSGSANDPVQILEHSTDFDCYVYLLDTDGTTVLASNDDSPRRQDDTTDSFVGFLLPSTGTYTIECTTFDAAVPGNYTVTLTSSGSGTVFYDTYTDTNGKTLGLGIGGDAHDPTFQTSGGGYTLLSGKQIAIQSNSASLPGGDSVCADYSSLYDLKIGSDTPGGLPLNAKYDISWTFTVATGQTTRHQFALMYAFGKQNDGSFAYGRVVYRLDTGQWTIEAATTSAGPWTTVATASMVLSNGSHDCLIHVRADGVTVLAGGTVVTSAGSGGVYLPFGMNAGLGATNDVGMYWFDEASAVTAYAYNDGFDGVDFMDAHLTAQGVGWGNNNVVDDWQMDGSGAARYTAASIAGAGSHNGYRLKTSPGWCADQNDVTVQWSLPNLGSIDTRAILGPRIAYTGFTQLTAAFDADTGDPTKYAVHLLINNSLVFSQTLAFVPTTLRIDTRSDRVKLYVEGTKLYDQPWTVAGDPGDANGFTGDPYVYMAVPVALWGGDASLIALQSFDATTGSRTSIGGAVLTSLRVAVVATENVAPTIGTADQCINPYTLTGTNILDVSTDARCMSATTHRRSAFSETEVELWYERDSGWHLFPIQPLVGPGQGLTLTQTYKQPYTLDFTLPDPQGNYAPENKNSLYNYGATAYDPLLDEARKIVLRVGTHCYTNLAAGVLPTSSLAPSAGPLSVLTDGVLGDIENSLGGYVSFAPTNAAPFTLTVDLGSAQLVRHAIIRFATFGNDGLSLPSAVQVSLSADNVTYAAWPVRPVGGAGSVSVTPGDWSDSVAGDAEGATPEFVFADMEHTARYVKFTITPTGAQTIALDELAVYGGNRFEVLGCNLFTGYLGDQIDFTPDGHIRCLAVDVRKKLADNNTVFLTAAYKLTSAGGVELADIAYSLLTASAYWRSATEYDSPWPVDFIGWNSGVGLTGLRYPLWQGQTNNMLGYQQELWATVGWNFYADGNGVLQATEPPYTQRLPDRVCVAAPDGNYDVSECMRHRTGKEMRNEVIVQTGKSKAAGTGTITSFEPNSIARFGTRTTRITDPLASTTELRKKVAAYFLRDYAWRLQTLTNTLRPDFTTRLKHIFGFRAPARPNLYSRTSVVTGDLRAQELWSLESLTHNITYGEWTAEAQWIPYVKRPLDPPNFTALNYEIFDHTTMDVVFDPITDPLAFAVRAYISTTSEFAGFTLKTGVPPGTGAATLAVLTPGVQIWVYLTTVDVDGNESIPSQILTAVPGSSSQSQTCYTINDFSISSILTEGPDSSGYYTYQFLALWTSPLCGFTQSWIGAALGSSPPSNPDDRIGSWPIHDDSWDWWGPNRIASGRTWDNVTLGQLDFTIVFRSTSNLSGQRIYFRIWNSAATRTWRPVEGNYAFTTIA